MPGKIDPHRLLVLMAKNPVPGRTKTRLIRALGEEGAAGLYDAFLHDKVVQMRLVPGVTPAVAYYPPDGRDYFAELVPDFVLIEQRGNSLAERLERVFSDSFSDGFGSVIAIDGDTPHLPDEYLQAGFAALEDGSSDVVIGPCEDGGYYAIGLKQPHGSLFHVQMSTPHVTRETRRIAEEAGLVVHLLPEWWDIDELPDLKRLARLMREEETRGGLPPSVTQNFLNELPVV